MVLRNTTIVIGKENSSSHNDNNSLFHILNAQSAMIPDFLRLPNHLQFLLCGFWWLLILIGSFFRRILYNFLFEQHKANELTPINKLLLVLITVQHLTQIHVALSATMMVFNITPFSWSTDNLDHGHWFCTTQKQLYEFEGYYSVVGSLMIAIYRILLIKHYHWVKYQIGEKTLLRIILLGGILFVLLCVGLKATDDYEQLMANTCMITPKRSIFLLLDEYEVSRGHSSIHSYWMYVQSIINLVMLIMTFAEFSIYIAFFRHMYLHNNTETLRSLLAPGVIKRRNRANAITFFGTFCSFVFELVVFFTIMLSVSKGNEENGLWTVLVTVRMVAFTSMTMIEVLTSSNLTSRVFTFSLYNLIFGLH